MNGIKKIRWKRGAAAANDAVTLEAGEISIDDGLRIRVHDGEAAGGFKLALASDLPVRLSDLADDLAVWKTAELTRLSQLTDDVGYWQKSALTKVSQLQNDSGFKTGHCSYCTHCSYCSQCGNCYNCSTVNCTTVKCTTVNCATVRCTLCTASNCDCDCSDDS